jgi:hypothetical protein
MKAGFLAFLNLLILCFCLLTPGTSAQAESTMNCPAGTYDMLDWMTLDSDLRAKYFLSGNSNPLYSTLSAGKFYWTKGANGSPWDIQLYDSKYIYLWITEYDWNNAHSYKKFAYNTNLPLAPRCARAGFPGSAIKVSNTAYRTYTDCTHYKTQDLLKAITEIWGPYQLSLGGSLPSNLQLLVNSYRYNCDSTYRNCKDKEEYYLSKRYGLVQWVHHVLVNGKYQVKQVTYFNQIRTGKTSPDFPCF